MSPPHLREAGPKCPRSRAGNISADATEELKVGPFTHARIGQFNTFVRWYAANEMTKGDSPPSARRRTTRWSSTPCRR